MFIAMTQEFALKPAIDRSIVKFYIMVQRGLKFIRIKDLNRSFLPS